MPERAMEYGPRERPNGRPVKLDGAVHDRIIKAITLGATYAHAANYAGIHYASLRRWMLEGEKCGCSSCVYCNLFEAVRNAEGEAVVTWLTQINDAAKEGNWQAAAWRLERRYHKDFGRKMLDVEVAKAPEQSADVNAVSLDEIIQMVERRLRAAGNTTFDAKQVVDDYLAEKFGKDRLGLEEPVDVEAEDADG